MSIKKCFTHESFILWPMREDRWFDSDEAYTSLIWNMGHFGNIHTTKSEDMNHFMCVLNHSTQSISIHTTYHFYLYSQTKFYTTIHSYALRLFYVIYMLFHEMVIDRGFGEQNIIESMLWMTLVLFNFYVKTFFYQSLIDGLTMSFQFDTLHSFKFFFYLYKTPNVRF